MSKTQRLLALISILALLASQSLAQDPKKQEKKQAASSTSTPVVGSGTAGQMTRWTGVDGSNTFSVGDSNVTEDKFGKVGIGTRTPTSLFTVRGVIESTVGGIKFPDGTIQTTAGISSVFHDTSLRGAGSASSPLGVAVPLNLSGSSAPPILNVVNSNGDGLRGASTSSAGVRGDSDTSVGVRGDSVNSIGVMGNGLGSGNGVNGDSVDGKGVSGHSASSIGVIGQSDSGDGTVGLGLTGVGVRGESERTFGVSAKSLFAAGLSAQGGTTMGNGSAGIVAKGGNGTFGSGGAGLEARGGSSNDSTGGIGGLIFGGNSNGNTSNAQGGEGLHVEAGAGTARGGTGIFVLGGAGVNTGVRGNAGNFIGNVDITGTLTKTMGTFKIDHPVDPENKYLYHSFVESPDMMNIYNGNITTDESGAAVVEMPGYFDSLNKDFRYQLTVIGTFAQAIVASKMKGNRFVIKTDAPNVEVSWMVTGVRQDGYANRNRVQVEVDKPEQERGYYLHPEVFNQPDEKSVQWALNPEMMQRRKQQRTDSEGKLKQQ
jgi:hypothetical protein